MSKSPRVFASLSVFVFLVAFTIAPSAQAITVSSVIDTGLYNINEMAIDPSNGDIYLNGYPSGSSELSIVKVSGSLLTTFYASLPGTSGGNLTYTNGFAVHGANLWWNNANSGPGSATEVSFATKAGGGTITRNSPTDDLDLLSSDGTTLFTAYYAGTLYTLSSDGSSVGFTGFHRSTSHLAIVADTGILYVVDDTGAYRRNTDGSFTDINTAPNTYLTNGSRVGEGGGLLFALDRNVHNGFWEINQTTGAAAFFSHPSFTNLNAISYRGGNLYASDTGEPASSPNSNGHVWQISNITTASCAVPPSEMVSGWACENNATDIQGGNNGAFNGTPAYTSGEVGQAFNFNGSSYVSIPDAANLSITGDLSIYAWVRPTANNGYMHVVSKRDFNNQNVTYELFRNADGTIGFASRNSGSNTFVNSSFTVPINTWSHLAVVINGSNLTFYLNGVASAPQTYSFSRPATTDVLTIGNAHGSFGDAEFWTGQLDEIELFNRGLNAAEINSIYTAGSAGKCRVFTPPASPSDADGHGTILSPLGGQATFDFDVALQQIKKKTRGVGTLSYNDPAANLSFKSNKITSLTLNGGNIHFTGTAKLTKKSQLSFTVDATDNGTPGTLDTFSIQVSNGYSAGGNLTSGDISVH